MSTLETDARGKLTVNASLGASPADLDFLQGDWSIDKRELPGRLTGSDKGGAFRATVTMKKYLLRVGYYGNFVTTSDGQPFEGMFLRLFSRETKCWSTYWADRNRGILDAPVVGSFGASRGDFYGCVMRACRTTLIKFNCYNPDSDNAVSSRAYSPDDGEGGGRNWYMNFHR